VVKFEEFLTLVGFR